MSIQKYLRRIPRENEDKRRIAPQVTWPALAFGEKFSNLNKCISLNNCVSSFDMKLCLQAERRGNAETKLVRLLTNQQNQ